MESHAPGACHEIPVRVSAARTRRRASTFGCLLALAVACGSVQSGDDHGGGGADGGAGGDNAAPTGVELSSASVEEQAPPGTRVGLLTAVDPDDGDHHTFELTADGDGQFAVDGAALVVAPGAILNYETGATVTVFGGAIQNQNKLVARDSIFRRNRGFNKAAIAADGDGGTLVERCTFQDNATTGNSGGAIGGGKLKVINSTFTGNSASNPDSDPVGGAVAIFYSGASEIAFSTIVDNAADGLGGGVYCNVSSGTATLTIRGSIVSNNAATTGPDMSINTGCTVVADHAVVQRGAGSTVSDGEGGSVVGSPVAVGALGDHGGLAPTLVPGAGAVSIDVVPAESCTDLAGDPLGEDQRGAARPAGEGCDAGSVEQ